MKITNKKQRNITVRINHELFERVKELATKEQRTQTTVLNRLVENGIRFEQQLKSA